MESLAAFLALACLICQFFNRRLAMGTLFAATLIAAAAAFALHTTDALKLNF